MVTETKEAFVQMAEGKNTANSCSGYGSDQWPNKTAGLVGPIDERFRIETKKKVREGAASPAIVTARQ